MADGIIYIATGKRYIDETRFSITSVQRWMPHIPITIFTDQSFDGIHVDQIVPIQSSGDGIRDKVVYMSQAPYSRTLFIDTDTYICEDFSEIFGLLDHFDLAAVQNPLRQIYPMENVPACFPEFNSGVVLFKKSPAMSTFFEDWLCRFDIDIQDRPRHFNQPSFRVALYHSQLRIATLPTEYNVRFFDGGFLHGHVKIVHGHAQPEQLKRIAHILNKTDNPRVFIGGRLYGQDKVGRFVRRLEAIHMGRYLDPIWKLGVNRFKTSLRQRGLKNTLTRITKRFYF